MRIQIFEQMSKGTPNHNSCSPLPSGFSKPYGHYKKLAEITVDDPRFEEVVIYASWKYMVLNTWSSSVGKPEQFYFEDYRILNISSSQVNLKEAQATLGMLLDFRCTQGGVTYHKKP